ncbi:hypothetical protein, partial [Pseudoalteromonas sp. McH1-7]|uniref:hypothetical protein n=1 Tax=Pseudoalteromonas sp. McH1-7 TaxID=2745574 RepID=UPI001C379DFB
IINTSKSNQHITKQSTPREVNSLPPRHQQSAALVGGGLPAELLGLPNKKNKTVYSVISRGKLAPTTTPAKCCTGRRRFTRRAVGLAKQKE